MNNLYKCLKCQGEFISDKVNTLDGQMCPLCRGPLEYNGKTEKEVTVEEVRDRNNNKTYKKKRNIGSFTIEGGTDKTDAYFEQESDIKYCPYCGSEAHEFKNKIHGCLGCGSVFSVMDKL